jgi:hypothetical protein
VDRLRDRVAHARHGADHVGARTQVRDVAQVLHAVRLGLDRVGVGVVDPADHLDLARLHLERLALGRRRHDDAGRLDGAAGGQVRDLDSVVRQRGRRDDLNRVEAGAVRDIDEGNARLRIAPRAHPALDGNGLIGRRLTAENLLNAEFCHCCVLA